MLEIKRLSWRRPQYAVHDDRGARGMWERHRFRETMAGELDGEPYELGRAARKHFFLAQTGQVLVTADAAKRGRWSISVGDTSFELRRPSAWRSAMELRRGEQPVGSIRKGRAPRGRTVCELPDELSSAVQAFIGFLVITLWNRGAASSGAGAVAATGSGA